MDINWKGQVLPLIVIEESDIIAEINKKFNIIFNIVSEKNGLEYGIRNSVFGSEVKVYNFVSPKDNLTKTAICLLLKFGDTWTEFYTKVEKESLTDEEVKEILFLALDECNM